MWSTKNTSAAGRKIIPSYVKLKTQTEDILKIYMHSGNVYLVVKSKKVMLNGYLSIEIIHKSITSIQ